VRAYQSLQHSNANPLTPALKRSSRKLSPLSLSQAFVSHSWRDSAEEKYRLLQEWRGRFVATRGREPTVWLDICCLHDNFLSSAALVVCLPVYMSGCKTLLALRGPTFLNRLW
jgi:hypothetical protein